MKTKNNVQKAIFKSLAIIVSLVLVSFTVSAQVFWQSLLVNSSFNEIALAMVESNPVSEMETSNAVSYGSLAYSEMLEVETEEELVVEDWMTHEFSHASGYTVESAAEGRLEVEDWMTSEAYYFAGSFNLEVETEEALEIENWMLDTEGFESKTDNKYITGRNFIFVNVEDNNLEVEEWMTDQKAWNN